MTPRGARSLLRTSTEGEQNRDLKGPRARKRPFSIQGGEPNKAEPAGGEWTRVLARGFYRRLEGTLDLSFVRDLAHPLYAKGRRSSVDPVVFSSCSS